MSEPTDDKMASVYRARRLIVSLVVVMLAGAGVGLLVILPARETKKPPAGRTILPVKVMRIEPEARFEDNFVLPGVVEPNLVVTVSAEVDGRVENIPCKEGRPCTRGDVMIALNQDLIGAAVKRAEAQRALDKYELDSVSELRAREVATDFAFNQATARLAAADAMLAAARARLDRTRIAAPIDGILNRLLVEQGEYVLVGAPVATIVDIRKVRVVVDVPERDIGYLKVNTAATVLPDMRGDLEAGREGKRTLSGQIDYISEMADNASRTTRVEVLVDNTDRALRSGQIVSVRLRRRVLKNTIMIPLAAVIPLENGKAVYVVKDGLAQRRLVDLGFFKGHWVQVLPAAASMPTTSKAAETLGLRAGDMLIVEGHRLVAPDQEVKSSMTSGDGSGTSWSARTGADR